jgi:hypothetical protein
MSFYFRSVLHGAHAVFSQSISTHPPPHPHFSPCLARTTLALSLSLTVEATTTGRLLTAALRLPAHLSAWAPSPSSPPRARLPSWLDRPSCRPPLATFTRRYAALPMCALPRLPSVRLCAPRPRCAALAPAPPRSAAPLARAAMPMEVESTAL